MEAAFHVKEIRTAWSGGLQSPFSGKAPPSSTPCGPPSTPTRQNRPRPRLFPLFRPNGATAPVVAGLELPDKTVGLVAEEDDAGGQLDPAQVSPDRTVQPPGDPAEL